MDSRRSARQCGKCRFYLDVCPCLFRKKVGYFDNCGPKGCRGRAESPLVRPQAHTPCHGGEGRADYGANGGAAAPSGAVLSFEAKESTKESTRHGDYGKKAFIAHFAGGARNVARNEAGQLTHTGGARSCSPFSAAKMGGPFSLRCLSPLCSGAVGVGQAYPLRGGMLSCGLGIFATQKASVKLKSRWPVL